MHLVLVTAVINCQDRINKSQWEWKSMNCLSYLCVERNTWKVQREKSYHWLKEPLQTDFFKKWAIHSFNALSKLLKNGVNHCMKSWQMTPRTEKRQCAALCIIQLLLAVEMRHRNARRGGGGGWPSWISQFIPVGTVKIFVNKMIIKMKMIQMRWFRVFVKKQLIVQLTTHHSFMNIKCFQRNKSAHICAQSQY